LVDEFDEVDGFSSHHKKKVVFNSPLFLDFFSELRKIHQPHQIHQPTVILRQW